MQRAIRTHCFTILGRRVEIQCSSAQFASDARRFLRSFPRCRGTVRGADLALAFEVAPPDAPQPVHALWRDGQRVATTNSYWSLFRLLEWQLTAFLSERVSNRYLIHGGAVAHDGVGFVLPAASGSGKSTLTLALVLRGFDYFSDELAVLEPTAGWLEPFPKPISSRDPGLFPVLAEAGTRWFGPEINGAQGVWYLHPNDLRLDAVGQAVPVRYVVFPHYDPDREPALQPLTPGETMRGLLENSVNFARVDHAGLALLASVTKSSRGFSLVSNHPDQAAELITRLDQDGRASPRAWGQTSQDRLPLLATSPHAPRRPFARHL